jgi:hypothetical protein
MRRDAANRGSIGDRVDLPSARIGGYVSCRLTRDAGSLLDNVIYDADGSRKSLHSTVM